MIIDYRGMIENGRLITRGIEWGRRNNRELWPSVLHRAGNIIVLKIHGHTGWVSQGQSGWHPSRYKLARCHEPDANGWMNIESIRGTEVEPGHHWRDAVEKLKAQAEALAKSEN